MERSGGSRKVIVALSPCNALPCVVIDMHKDKKKPWCETFPDCRNAAFLPMLSLEQEKIFRCVAREGPISSPWASHPSITHNVLRHHAHCASHVYLRPSLNRKLSCPFPGRRFISSTIGFVDVCDLWYEWVVGIWVGQHGADGKED